MSLIGSQHDSGIYKEADPYRFLQEYFTDDDNLICDKIFQWRGRQIMFALKKKQYRFYPAIYALKRDYQKQRIRKQWSIGLISHMFRVFLGY